MLNAAAFPEAKRLIETTVQDYRTDRAGKKLTNAEVRALDRLSTIVEAFGDSSTPNTLSEFKRLLGRVTQVGLDEKDTSILPFVADSQPMICTHTIPDLVENLRGLNVTAEAAPGAAQSEELRRLGERLDAMEETGVRLNATQQVLLGFADFLVARGQASEALGTIPQALLEEATKGDSGAPLRPLLTMGSQGDTEHAIGAAAGDSDDAQSSASSRSTGGKVEALDELPGKYTVSHEAVPRTKAEQQQWLQHPENSAENQIVFGRSTLKKCVSDAVFAAIWDLMEYRSTLAEVPSEHSAALHTGAQATQEIKTVDEIIYRLLFSTLVNKADYSTEKWSEKMDVITHAVPQEKSPRLAAIIERIKETNYSDTLTSEFSLAVRIPVLKSASSKGYWLPKGEAQEHCFAEASPYAATMPVAELDC